jgi:hypothetical protein
VTEISRTKENKEKLRVPICWFFRYKWMWELKI